MIGRMRRRLGADRRTDTGLTLVELLIAMGIAALIATLAGSLFVASTHSVSLAQSIDNGTRQGSNGMNEMARMVRAATPNPLANPTPGGAQNDPAFVSATATSVLFYAFVNLSGAESPVKVQFAVVNGQLVESQWKATTTTAGTNGHWDFNTSATPDLKRTLCGSIPSSVVVFQYFDASGAPLTLPISTLSAIASITITITIQPTGAASAVTLTNSVGMSNIGSGS
ncbi:hypothetical protein ASE16_10715 [Leifsonia sp. Root227]|nr:hypothetical protein ASE16_10715 [Leifsonia sp. Root227]